ncbi:MAG: proton-conducting transporter membrane subunit, partial [candidate division WOR-3 bacterium]
MTLSGGLWTEFGGSRIELFFVVLFAFIGLMALLGSIARLRGRGGQLAEYYSFLVLLVLCAIAVVFAQNLLLVFVFWELSTVALWRLVSYLRRDEDMDAGVWALYVNFAAAALMLVGLGMIWI